MILKSLSRQSNSGQLLQYILRYTTTQKQAKDTKEQHPKAKPFLILHNCRARSLKGFIREFKNVESLRQHPRAGQVEVFHTLLSWSAKDKEHINDAMLKDMSAKFIELHASNQIVVGTKHTDRENTVHIHLAVSAIDLAGRSVRKSKAQFQKLKSELQRYQHERYPAIVHSSPDHGKKSRIATREQIAVQAKLERASNKEALLAALEMSVAKATTLKEFLADLTAQGYIPYERAGRLTGVTTEDGRKFRLTTLGYNPVELTVQYQEKERQEKELAELQALRSGSSKHRDILLPENAKEGTPPEQDDVAKELQELQSLRGEDDGREIDEKDADSNEKDTEKEHKDEHQKNDRDDTSDGDSRSR